MANSPILDLSARATKRYVKALDITLATLEKRVVSILAATIISDSDRYDVATLISARPQILAALKEAGYYDVANAHVANYAGIVDKAKDAFKRKRLPEPKFANADLDTFKQLAAVDLERFEAIGQTAMNELHYQLVQQAVIRAPFAEMVWSVKQHTTGTDAAGAALKRYSYTHANTAILNFGGETLRIAGENIGATKWVCVGPRDNVTRPECLHALRAGAMTEAEWKKLDYWGGTPGGWNCRHQLFPAYD